MFGIVRMRCFGGDDMDGLKTSRVLIELGRVDYRDMVPNYWDGVRWDTRVRILEL